MPSQTRAAQEARRKAQAEKTEKQAGCFAGIVFLLVFVVPIGACLYMQHAADEWAKTPEGKAAEAERKRQEAEALEYFLDRDPR